MDEAYRLVFRGEVLDGQHSAVVKKRLVDALKLNDKQAEKLFSGSAMVVKGHADTKTAARYQRLFKQAGARLRVEPGGSVAAEPAASAPGMQVLPVGADVLRSDERRQAATATVDVSHLGIQEGEPESAVEPSALVVASVPDFSVADLGVDLVDHREPETIDIDPDFDLAELGADIPTIPVDRTPVVDMATIRFDVAEVGADIGTPQPEAKAIAPDISHLNLVAP